MRKGAIYGAAVSFIFFMFWLVAGIDESLTIQQTIMCGAMLLSCFICLSNMEK